MKTKPWAIILVFICTLLTSSAQVLYKFGAEQLTFNIVDLIQNYYIIGGLALYAVGAVLLITGLKGGDLSVLYPIVATGYIWVAFYSMFFFNEPMNFIKWFGILVIIGGISLIGVGSRHKDIIEYTEAV